MLNGDVEPRRCLSISTPGDINAVQNNRPSTSTSRIGSRDLCQSSCYSEPTGLFDPEFVSSSVRSSICC